MLNYHFLKVKNLKKVVGELKANLPKEFANSLNYMQVNYDTVTGDLWADFFHGCNDWRKVYHDEDVITVARYRKQHTMQEILDDIQEACKVNNKCQYSFIKAWYLEKYPTDDVGNTLNDDITFSGAYNCLLDGNDIYSYLGGDADSVVRERLFTELARIYKKDYNYFYDLWLHK